MAFNRVIVQGNLTRDPVVKQVGGSTLAELGLAINERRKKGNEWVNETVFVNVTVWGRTAEIAHQYLHKGEPVLIEGKLRLEQWKSEGREMSKLKVVGERLVLLGGSGGRGQKSGGGRRDEYSEPDDEQPQEAMAGANDDEGIPF